MQDDSSATTANEKQIDYWDQTAGPRWVAMQDSLDRLIGPLGVEARRRGAPSAGESVLDVGCGCGQTLLELAEDVGESGSVTGVDVSSPMVARANERAADGGFKNIEAFVADAQVYDFEPGAYDLAYSRFGVMFFDDPLAALGNLGRAIEGGGRMSFVCWQAITENPWMFEPTRAAMAHVAVEAPTDPHAPGPFAFADRERLLGLLTGAGFGDVLVEPFEVEMEVGGGAELDQTVEFMLQMGPAAQAVREADAQAAKAARGAVREALEPYYSAERGVIMPGRSWIVSARA
jgi:SAM-dependent methyltransferase